jgi:hypothetical protein
VAEHDRGSEDPRLAAIARHALHDEELIAAFAAGDVDDPADAARAQSFLERCQTCRDLHRDLQALAEAIRSSGSAAQRSATLTTPRDFRLTAQDAARLRPASPAARIAVRLGWRSRVSLAIATFGRPVGAAMATLGVVGVLIGSLTMGGVPLASVGGAAAPPATAAGLDQGGPLPEATGSRGSYRPFETLTGGAAGPGAPTSIGSAPAGPVLLFGGSIFLVVIGIGLILAARRDVGSIPTPGGN